jgi:hypothetical protein
MAPNRCGVPSPPVSATRSASTGISTRASSTPATMVRTTGASNYHRSTSAASCRVPSTGCLGFSLAARTCAGTTVSGRSRHGPLTAWNALSRPFPPAAPPWPSPSYPAVQCHPIWKAMRSSPCVAAGRRGPRAGRRETRPRGVNLEFLIKLSPILFSLPLYSRHGRLNFTGTAGTKACARSLRGRGGARRRRPDHRFSTRRWEPLGTPGRCRHRSGRRSLLHNCYRSRKRGDDGTD